MTPATQARVPPAAVAVVTLILAACAPAVPTIPDVGGGAAQQSIAPTPAPAKLPPARSVSVVGSTVVASGDFRGSGKSQLALLQDPTGDLSLRITIRDANSDGDTFSESTWLTAPPGSFALSRAKFAVADVNFDGKADLVALYKDGDSVARLLVFRSTGTSFAFAEAWWRNEDYSWSRARNVFGASISGVEHDGVLVTYQYDDAQMRVHSFESTGSSFVYGGSQGIFDSGPGQFDTARARFAVGRFTRTGGPQQLAAFYQLPNAKARLLVFDPTSNGLVLVNGWNGVYETNEGEYDLARATIAAADATGDSKDDLLALYAAPDGSARLQLFDAATSFRPVSGWTGVASLPPSSVCLAATGLVVGNWNGEGRADAAALVGADEGKVRQHLLRNMGTGFKLTSSAEETLCPRWPLTGLPLNGGPVSRRPLYVKIDNNAHARPHYGIGKADQVYEWLVEGLTTRLAAVFHSQEPGVIGSVRSARITDAPIVPSLGAAFVYSGGGPEELMRLNYDDTVHRYIDLRPGYGWGYRVPFREAPYNYFTTYQALRDALATAPGGDQPVDVAAWNFLPPSNTDPLAGGFAASVAAGTVTIPYRAGFGVRYQYEPASRTYARYDDGVREVDGANGDAVAVRDIVVIQTEVHFTDAFGFDPAGNPKLDMQLTGTGKGVVFRDGRRQDVAWSRPDIFDVFTLRTAAGEVVRLSPGQTWIHIVPSDWSIPNQ